MTVNLIFKVEVECEEENADELGRDLAVFLEESWFNGEDVVNVKYIGQGMEL